MANETIWDFWAPRYERLWAQRFSLRPSRRLIHERLAALGLTPARILDVGCGTGQLARELCERHPSAQVVGLDPSASMITRAKERAHLRLHVAVGGVDEAPRDAPFDLIVSTHALPYMPDQAGAIARMASLLAPGGRLMLLCAMTVGRWDRLFLAGVSLTTSRAHYPSVGEVRGLMGAAGLTLGPVTPLRTAPWMPSICLVEATR